MNGNGRLYRSTANSMLGGVCAGLGDYLKIDPTIIRIIFLALMLASGGAFLLVYLALCVLIPASGSATTDSNQIIRDNMNEMGAKFRTFVSPSGTSNPTTTASVQNGDPNANQAQMPQGGSAAQTRQGVTPQVLILVGLFFLLVNLGIFRAIHWGMWWPVLLVGVGVLMLSRRTQ